MKILLLGSGGREHALAWKIAQSPKVEKLYIAPGNAGTTAVGENVNIKATDFEAISAFALKEDIAMVIVGPEDRCYRSLRTGSRTGRKQGICKRLHDASQHPDSPLQKYHFRNY